MQTGGREVHQYSECAPLWQVGCLDAHADLPHGDVLHGGLRRYAVRLLTALYLKVALDLSKIRIAGPPEPPGPREPPQGLPGPPRDSHR